MLFAGWVVCITLLSLAPPIQRGWGIERLQISYADKIAHGVFYLVFAILGCLCIRERTQDRWKPIQTTIGVLLVAVAYGTLIEGLQHIITQYRTAELGDILANTMGALAGLGIIKGFFARKKRRSQNK